MTGSFKRALGNGGKSFRHPEDVPEATLNVLQPVGCFNPGGEIPALLVSVYSTRLAKCWPTGCIAFSHLAKLSPPWANANIVSMLMCWHCIAWEWCMRTRLKYDPPPTRRNSSDTKQVSSILSLLFSAQHQLGRGSFVSFILFLGSWRR